MKKYSTTNITKILLTNDDGISAPGLFYLWESLKDRGQLTIVAPDKEKSGAGAGITILKPLRAETVDLYYNTPAWKVGGTPADCVKLAVTALLDPPPTLIVSGINHGSNVGRNIFYSGTIGGVIEGVLRGIPGIAFSYASVETSTFPHVKSFIPHIVDYVIKHPLPFGSFLNINFPHVDEGRFQGFKMVRQGKSFWMEASEYNIEKGDRHSHYWMHNVCVDYEESDCDTTFLNKGYATVVPIHIHELTDQRYLSEKKEIFEQQLNRDSLCTFT